MKESRNSPEMNGDTVERGYALFSNGERIGKLHSTKRACMAEAYHRAFVWNIFTGSPGNYNGPRLVDWITIEASKEDTPS